MNPHPNASPGLHLPQPTPTPAPQAESGPIAAVPPTPPAMPSYAPTFMQPPQPGPSGQSPMPHAPATQPGPVESNAPGAAAAGISELADEHQDEEWINKAKEIVDQNRTDPYMQSRELGRLKAQYLKTRYNKDIKTGKDQT